MDEAKEDHLRTEHDGEREESDAEQHVVEQRYRAEVRGDTITSRLSTTSAADIDSSHQKRAKRETNYTSRRAVGQRLSSLIRKVQCDKGKLLVKCLDLFIRTCHHHANPAKHLKIADNIHDHADEHRRAKHD